MHDVNLNSPHGPQIFNRAASGGQSGSNGYTFIPQVSPEGIISWTNNGELPNPDPVNIMGPEGPAGKQGPQGPAGQVPIIDFGEQVADTPFTITAEQMQQLIADVPPIVQVTVDGYSVALYRFTHNETVAYYSNIIYFNNKKYFVNLSASGTEATFQSISEEVTPASP